MGRGRGKLKQELARWALLTVLTVSGPAFASAFNQ